LPAPSLPLPHMPSNPTANPPGSSISPKLSAHHAHNHPNPRTRLLSELYSDNISDNGTFSTPIGSPRPGSPVDCTSSIRSGRSGRAVSIRNKPGWVRRATMTTNIAEEAGVKRPWLMYLSYYIPCIAWVGHYQWSFLVGDVAAGSL
jgi:hypothetical protein